MRMTTEEDEEELVTLDASFFVNNEYNLTSFTCGTHSLELFCLQSASTDFDLTGQLVWPGALLLNDYICQNSELFRDSSVLELGSGVGISGLLCSKFCRRVVLTDHNDEILKILNKNIEHQVSTTKHCDVTAEKLEWGIENDLARIQKKYPNGFDIIMGADICFQQASIASLFDTVTRLLQLQRSHCKFLLAYVSRAKTMDELVVKEAKDHGLSIKEVKGNRGIIFVMSLR